MLTSYKNKSVIVTGATKGIGKGIALNFAKQGAKVLLVSRSIEAGEIVVAELKSEGFTDVFYMAADVSSENEMQVVADYANTRLGVVDCICVNAGIYPDKKIEDMSGEDWDLVSNTNLKGTFITVKTLLPLMKKSEHGRVILTSSITGPVTGYPGWSHYGATKAGQLGFMRTAAIELAKYNITINAVLPGNIMTEGLADLGEKYLKKMADSIPLKRLGTVDDIANTVMFLASKEASYITGQAIVIDGGQILPECLEALE